MNKRQEWIEENKNKHLCKCGCGEFVVPNMHRWYQGKSLDFIDRHQNRGKNHPNYKGGAVTAKGYNWVLRKGHPRTTPRGYVKVCWLVAEQKLGRFLLPSEVVHHKDGIKTNDSPGNLYVTDHVTHGKEHNSGNRNQAYRQDINTERDIKPLVEKGLTRKQISSLLHCGLSTIDRRMKKLKPV